jgi:hypothetical protein
MQWKFVVVIGLNAYMQSNIISIVPLKFSGKSKGHVKIKGRSIPAAGRGGVFQGYLDFVHLELKQ